MKKAKALQTYTIEVIASVQVSATYTISATSLPKAEAEAEDKFESEFDCDLDTGEDASFDIWDMTTTVIDNED